MKKILLVTLIMSLLLIFSAAASLEVEVEKISNSIYLDEQARYSISISNPDDVDKTLRVFSSDVGWYVQLEPSVTTLQPNSSVDLELRLIPNVWTETGAQSVNVFVESPSAKDSVSMLVPVYVKSFDTGTKQYSPSVEIKITYPEEIDPREKIPLSIYMRNRNWLDITEMELAVESSLFTDYRTIALGPLSERTERLFFEIDPTTLPQDDKVEIRLKVGDRTINKERISFKVVEYSGFVTSVETIEELFKTRREISVINEGNVQRTDDVEAATSFLRKLFTTTSTPADEVDLKDGVYRWTLTLGPYEEAEFVVVENYRPIIYIALIAIVLILVYFLYRSPVILKKEAIVTGASETGISEMKVLLHIRNRSQDLMEKITVTDMIPSIAELIRETKVGTIKPSKIVKHEKKGTIIKWELEALEPFEERIITFRLKSKIVIVGGFTLPAAKVKFETGRGKERTVRSGKSKVSTGL